MLVERYGDYAVKCAGLRHLGFPAPWIEIGFETDELREYLHKNYH